MYINIYSQANKHLFKLLNLHTGLLVISLVSSNAIAAETLKLPESLPIIMSFGPFHGLKFGSAAYKARFDEIAPYSWIHTRPDEIGIIHARWSDKIVTTQEAYGGISIPFFSKVWPGHLLYKAGTLLTKDLSAEDIILTVSDGNRIAKSNKQIDNKNKSVPFSLIIYALDPSGKPDWSQAEHVIVESMNDQGFVVKRGQWGSKPLTFKAGKAVVAEHIMFWTRQWQVNFSLHSPRGGIDNLTGAEWFARHIAQRLAESKADGVEFDVARWVFGSPAIHPLDVNNDLVPDYGYIDGVNSFGLGAQVFLRELRQLVGPNKIIQADSNRAINGARGWKYLNGVQLESFPSSNDLDRFSESFLHFRLWVKNAEAQPQVSYGFTRLPTTTFTNYRLPNGQSTDFGFRIGFAAACLVGMPHPFSNTNAGNFDPENPSINNSSEMMVTNGVFNWDEYHGGDLNDWHWLGKPTGEAAQDLTDLDKTDKLAKASWQWSFDNGFKAQHTESINGFSATVQTIPNGIIPEQMWNGVRLAPKDGDVKTLEPGHEYTLEFEARGDDGWYYANQNFERVPRMITISGAVTTQKTDQPLSVLVDSQWRTYRLSFIADGSQAPTPIFGVSEQIGTTEIRNIKLYEGGAERWSREFEKGLVLLNMTNDPWTVTLPKAKYKHLKGKQDPEINNGQPIDNEVVVPARDALFLTKTSALNLKQ